MSRVKRLLEERIAELIAKLDAKFKVDRAMLFGSTARGDRLEESDVDLIVVSKGFEGLSIPERLGEVQKEWDYGEELQVLAYTPEEFSRISRRSTMQEILSYATDVTPVKRFPTCPRCGGKGSIQTKLIKNKLGKVYPYYYYAHYKDGKVKWCYLGKVLPRIQEEF